MLRNKLVRSDGSIIDSSVIVSCEFTEGVNSNTNLTVGDVTASELTVEIRATASIQQDDVLTYYIIEDGVEHKIGVFNAEKPTVATRTTMRFSAYDNIIKTEKLFSDWLRDNQNLFPMSLITLVRQACAHCGVTLATTDFQNASITVNAFYADDITCRQILAWAGAIAGCFVRANTAGELEFAWYTNSVTVDVIPDWSNNASAAVVRDDGDGNVTIIANDAEVIDDGSGNVSVNSSALNLIDDGEGNLLLSATKSSVPFMQGSLSYENYTTDSIERVQINHAENDVGVIYPEEADGNCFTISGNMILGTFGREDLLLIARSLYEKLVSVIYVPYSVTVPRTIIVRAGNRIRITDSEGNSFESYVMEVALTSKGTTLSSTGDKSYGSNAAVSSEKYSNLTGKVLSLSKSVDGLVIQNQALDGKIGGLELTTEAFKTYVETSFVSGENFEKYKSELEQTATDFTQRFDSLDQYRNETSAHVKTGLLGYTSGNVPVYGVEIGQRTEVDGSETFNKYARFTSDKLSFFDQGGNEVASVGDRKLSIAHAEITGDGTAGSTDYGSFRQGGFVDTTQADGSIVTKWVGGVN